jgi:hypothetical protein
MPLRLNCGLSKKIGQPDFGSLGASVNFEVELEHSLIRQPDELKQKIQFLFGLAKNAVEQELSSHDRQEANGHGANGNGTQRPAHVRAATSSQVRAIHAIADRNRIDLPVQLRETFGVEQPADLSISEASTLIDTLKSQTNGAGGRR